MSNFNSESGIVGIQENGPTCQGCQNSFIGSLLVPDGVWHEITKGTGITNIRTLCPNCIMRRIRQKGIWSEAHAVGRTEDVQELNAWREYTRRKKCRAVPARRFMLPVKYSNIPVYVDDAGVILVGIKGLGTYFGFNNNPMQDALIASIPNFTTNVMYREGETTLVRELSLVRVKDLDLCRHLLVSDADVQVWDTVKRTALCLSEQHAFTFGSQCSLLYMGDIPNA